MSNEKRCFLPNCGRRYSIDTNGRVYKGSNLLSTITSKDGCFVKLNWVLGSRLYSVALLMLIVYGDLTLPDYLWDYVEPLYLDMDFTNLDIGNLSYRFSCGKLPVEEYPGYYYVPFYTAYCVNDRGDLKNISTGKSLMWYTVKPCKVRNSKGGYKACRVVIRKRLSKVLFRHRALALVFINYDHTLKYKVVNHINGEPSDDTLSNLEWVTPSENNSHAYRTGLRNTRHMAVKDYSDGTIKTFATISECAKYCNLTSSALFYRMKKSQGKIFADKLVVRYLDDTRPWPDISELTGFLRDDPLDIICLNVLTKETYLFESVQSCANYFRVSNYIIKDKVSTLSTVPLKHMIFRVCKSNVIWPIYSDEYLTMVREYSALRAAFYTIKNTLTGELTHVPTRQAAALFTGADLHELDFCVERGKILKHCYFVKRDTLEESSPSVTGG